jgi:hypothetical protein
MKQMVKVVKKISIMTIISVRREKLLSISMIFKPQYDIDMVYLSLNFAIEFNLKR